MSAVVFQSSQTATAAASTVAVSKPASLAVGDFMLAQVTAYDSSAGSVVAPSTPSGWTLAVAGANSRIFYRFADAADVAATDFTFAAPPANRTTAAISRFTNVDPVTPINASNHGSGFGSSPSSSGITVTTASMLVIMIGSWDSTLRTGSGYAVATTNPTWTEAYDFGGGSPGTCQQMAYAGGRSAVTPTGNATATLSGAMTYTLMILALAPAVVRPAVFAGGAFGMLAALIPVRPMVLPLTVTFLAPVVNIIESAWTNATKHVSTWLNLDKS